MKTNFIMILALSGASLLMACGDHTNRQSADVSTSEEVEQERKGAAETADVDFKDGMTAKVFHNYLQVKMALVNTDLDGAKEASANLSESFSEEWPELRRLSIQMKDAMDIEQFRSLFSMFTDQVTPLIEENLSGGTIYKQYCPMAFNNNGAYWLSDVEEIRNPYFGDKMLKCGKVEREISK